MVLFKTEVTVKITDLLLHELGHHGGLMHTETVYHEALTRMGAELVIIALKEPAFFERG